MDSVLRQLVKENFGDNLKNGRFIRKGEAKPAVKAP